MTRRLSKEERERLEKEHERARSENAGSVLGLGRTPERTAEDTVHASDDPEEAQRRRARALGEDEIEETASGGLRPSSGATGIDMGSGGQGTDLDAPSTRKRRP